MAKHTTTLNFETENQSLWAPGEVIPLQIDTGDDLIWTTGGSHDVGFDLLGNGFEAEAYLDLTIGLFAFASLGESGTFDASLTMSVTADMPGGILIDTLGSNQPIPTTFTVDFSSWSLTGAELETAGFSVGAKAGLHLILGIEAGLRNGSYFHWLGGDTFDNITLIDLDFSEPLDSSIPLVEINSATPELELELTDGITITASLPSGADTEEQTDFSQSQAPTITASGSSDQFVSLNADLDELLVKYASKLPGVGAIIKGLGETVFAEHKFDLNDYVSFIPRGKLNLEATVLDIGASVGLVITEENTLDFGGGDATPDVQVTLRSDNGTPTNMLDDQIRTTVLGGSVDFDRPVYDPTATGPGDVADIGEITVEATYTLPNVRFDHKIGLGLNTVFTIEALTAELGGAWVPSSVQVNFGPILSLELPDGGFTVDLFSVPLPGFDLVQNAFNSVTDSYEIFYTTELAPSQTSEADLEHPNARQAIIDYREARQANLAETAAALGDLIDGTFQQVAVLAGSNNFSPLITSPKYLSIWDGEQTSIVTGLRGQDELLVINPLNPGTGRLTVNMLDAIGGTPLLVTPMRFDTANVSAQTLLLNMDSVAAGAMEYTWDKFSGTDHTLTSQAPATIIGGDYGDVIMWFDAHGQPMPQLMDGGANLNGEYDVFIGNFAESYNNVAIEWDLAEDVATGNGVTLGQGEFDLSVRNVEAIQIITGDEADYITGYIHSDYIYTNGGEDFVILPGDNADDTAYLGDGDDYLRTEFKAGGGADLVWGGRGYDLVTVRADAAGLGLRVDVIGNDVRSAGGQGYHTGSSTLELLTLMNDYRTMVVYGSTLDQENRTGLVGTDHIGDIVRYSQLDGSGTESIINFNSSVENLSVEGQDDDGDLVLFTGGHLYEGGTDLDDTFVGDFTLFEDVSGGISLSGYGDLSLFGSELQNIGNTSVRGFERLIIRATYYNDRIDGGAKADYIDGSYGQDVIFGGADHEIDVISAGYGNDHVWWYNSGADIMHGGTISNNFDYEEDRDTLVIASSFGTVSVPVGGLNYAFLSDLGNFDGTGRSLRSGPGIVNASSGSQNLVTAMGLAAQTHLATAVSFGLSNLDEFAVFTGFEKVNISGSDAHDDLLIYTGGATYIAGERAFDEDVFVADFSGQVQGIDLRITEDDTTGQRLENGVFVQGIDRLVVVGGKGADVIHGGRLDDHISGGAGVDRLFGGWGDDDLFGNDGDDVVYWTVDGWDVADGGAGNDRLIVTGADPDGNARALGVLLDGGQASEFEHIGGDLSLLGIEAMLYSLGIATTKSIRAETLGSEPLTTHIELEYSNFELIDVIGADGVSDLIFYDGGHLYWGGNGAVDDLFVANLSVETDDLYFDVGHMSESAQFVQDDFANPGGTGFAGTFNIGNGTFIGAFERLGLQLGSGHDRAVGGSQADFLSGGAGDDTLESGGSGADRDILRGEAGDDLLVYSSGRALLDGGSGGADRAQLGELSTPIALGIGDSSGIAALFAATGLASFADFTGLKTSFSFYPTSHTSFLGDLSGSVENIVTLTNIERLSIHGSGLDDVLMGMSAYSQIYGGAGDDVMISGTGDDLLLGGAGTDRYVFFDGFGDDLIAGETLGGGELYFVDYNLADLTFSNTSGDLEILTPNGKVRINDWYDLGGLDFTIHTIDNPLGVLVPGDAPGGTAQIWNIIDGTPGNDVGLAGTAGNDSIRGGAGNDEMLGSAGSDVFEGGAGTDVVSYAHLTGTVYINLDIHQGLGGESAGDIFGNVEGIIAGQGSAILIGDVEDNFFAGSNQGDYLFGYDGDDMMIGLEGDDTFYGGGGGDALYGDEGADTIAAEGGNDYVDGGSGNDTIDGGSGNDTLTGGDGNDTVLGQAGADVIFYGGDDLPDTVIVEGGLDSLDGGADIDLIDLSTFSQSAIIDLAAGRIDTNDAPAADPGGTLRQIAILQGFEEARGTGFDDIIRGNASNNVIEGGLGDDTLSGGGAGQNTLFGGDGFDVVDYSTLGEAAYLDFDPNFAPTTMYGTGFQDQLISIEGVIGSDQGDDVIFGDDNNFAAMGLGNDNIYGLGGDDVLGGGGGLDYIDGGDGIDIYDVSDGTSAVNIDIEFGIWEDGHGNTELVVATEGVRGTDLNDTIAGDAGTNIIQGGGGDDSLIGHGGADLLDGGIGNDTLIAGAPQLVLVKPRSFENNLDEEAPNLNDYLTDAPRRTAGVAAPTATVHGITSGAKEVYQITVNAGDTVTVDIDRTSGSFDPYLLLFNTSAVILARSDDGPSDPGSNDSNGYLDSRLVHTFDFGGTYTIQLNAYNYNDDIGEIDPIAPYAGDAYVMHVSLEGGTAIDAVEAGSVLFGGSGNDSLVGNTGEDELVGGAGDDTLLGGDDDDLLDGSAGNDSMEGGAGNDLLGGGDDQDTLSGGTGRDTVNGGAGNDLLLDDAETGPAGNDWFIGGLGNDTILAQGGDDTLSGDEGNDSLDGGVGNDQLFGGSGADTLLGGLGNDTVVGGNGPDRVLLGDGADLFSDSNQGGVNGRDTVFGGLGNDTINGGGGDDEFHGNEGDDSISAGLGNDSVFGGSGFDTINGGGGADTVYGGDGRDMVALGDGDDVFFDTGQSGALGRDTVDGGDGNDTINGGGGDDLFQGGDGNDEILGGDGADTLEGGADSDTLRGGAGIDRLVGGAEDDVYYVDTAADLTIELAAGGIDSVFSLSSFALRDSSQFTENLTLSGTADLNGTGNGLANVITGNSGANLLDGALGADTIIAGDGNDTVIGGDGPDRIELNQGADVFTDNGQVGPLGNDTVFGGLGNDTLNGAAGNDELHGQAGDDSITGGLGDDLLIGGDGFDTVLAGDGADTVYGGNGRDRIELMLGNDIFFDTSQGGINGQDTVFAGIGNDTVEGGGGNDAFYGQDGDDVINGRLGDDLIFGGAGFDTLNSGEGADTVHGGDGRDRVLLEAGNDIFFDTAQGGVNGRDTVIAGAGEDTIEGGNGDDEFHGNAGNDLIHGRLGNDTIYGGDNFDTIYAGDGNDLVFGGNGRDLVLLGTGVDRYIDTAQGGVNGQDTVTGGTGADTFVFAAITGADVITDFVKGTDRLELDDALWGGGLTAAQVVSTYATDTGPNILLDFGAGNTILLQGVGNLGGLASDIDIV